ncbi:MAG: hypothetical protein ACFFAO_13470 [Candidatus Hermodarchaeota archaeon]
MREESDTLDQDSNSIKDYFKLGWELYKDYYKPLIGAQVLALITSICISIILIIVYSVILWNFSSIIQLFDAIYLSGILFLGILIPGFICFVAFIGSLYGMSNEIISSGDYYTELKSSFTYFRKYWWQYFLIALCLILGYLGAIILSIFVSQLVPVFPMIAFLVIMLSVRFLFIILVMLFPVALSSTGSLKKAFNQTFSLVKNNPKLYLPIFAIFFILTILIEIIFDILTENYNNSIILLIFILILSIMGFFILFPYMVLVSTAMYHSNFNQEELDGREKE